MRHIIWDMGGTLVDTYPEVDRVLCEAAFGDADPAHLHHVTELTRHSIAHAIATLSEEQRLDPHGLEEAYDDLKERWHTQPAPVMDGAREVMARVRSLGGLNLLATHRDRDSATALLQGLHLKMDDIVCAPDGVARKPSPDMNLLLAERHRLDPAEVLCVGDRPIDVVAARGAGMPAALLVRPGTSVTLPDDAPGALVVASLRDLLPLLD
ncbi:MAG: HAD-IA family hydrolase [Actinomyces succiniciruminis]|uniref:Phosphoglycolate phosphatase n=1 Tax=Actinomyces succiniciruminis TaxID=1522002 RepID=A0A1L7RT28_9ACTO|nr:HAD-IA family hydrolase [Actinomyces succiniciruminis]MBE6474435.1 HAD family hydrolase [Actinomyces succiniciruminis]MBM6978338.1 HAD-IA family hydrolase [Actinomyces succiniciruminis]CED92594.1 Phosphoglycolate phosphatase [Actinomyces succiniciruminis]